MSGAMINAALLVHFVGAGTIAHLLDTLHMFHPLVFLSNRKMTLALVALIFMERTVSPPTHFIKLLLLRCSDRTSGWVNVSN